MIVLKKSKILFVHNPKAMGTSITEVLLRLGGKRILEKHSRIAKLKDDDILNNYFKFGICRNPLDWVVSQYYYAKPLADKSPNRYSSWTLLAETNFDEFIQELVKIPNNLLPEEYETPAFPYFSYQICFGQKPFFYDGDKLSVDYVGKFEDNFSIKNMLEEKLGISINIPHINRSDHSEYMYTDKTKQLIYDYFIKDFLTFNYAIA